LHLACTQVADGPPIETIKCLVHAWPESACVPQWRPDDDKDADDYYPLALALDLVCMTATQPSSELLLLLLTNKIPPLHFACGHVWGKHRTTTIHHLSKIFPHDRMRFYHGKLPFHYACHARAPYDFLKWWLDQCPDAVRTPTIDTNDFPLHCYLTRNVLIKGITLNHQIEEWLEEQEQEQQSSFLSAVMYLTIQYPDAMRSTNRMGWLPLHTAALHDAPLDVVFHLARQVPELLCTNVVV